MSDTIKAALITGIFGIIGSVTTALIGAYHGEQDAINKVNLQVEKEVIENDGLCINNLGDLIDEYNKLVAENVELKAKNNIPYEEYSNLQQAYGELINKYTDLENQYNSLSESNMSIQDIKSDLEKTEGINAIESYNLMIYVNQYRTKAGIPELSWDPELARYAQEFIIARAAGDLSDETDSTIYWTSIKRTAIQDTQKIVSEWIEGSDSITSDANSLLSATFTQMGGALYYSSDGDERGFHYFWIIFLK